MGIFAERVVSPEDLSAAVIDSLRADPTHADDRAVVERHVAAAKKATKGNVKYHWSRILAGVAIAAVLLTVGIVLAAIADNWAADQALKAANTDGYTAPASSLPGIATSVIALATAWSGALVGALFNENA